MQDFKTKLYYLRKNVANGVTPEHVTSAFLDALEDFEDLCARAADEVLCAVEDDAGVEATVRERVRGNLHALGDSLAHMLTVVDDVPGRPT